MNFPCILLSSGLLLAALSGCSSLPGFSGTAYQLPAEWKNAGKFPVASPNRDLSRWWNRFGDSALNQVISTALQSSPDLSLAKARVREARANRDAARSSLFPNLTGGTSASSTSTANNPGANNSASNYAANLNASWEVDLFGRNRSSVEAASANLGAAQETLHSVHASLAAEVATAYINLRANQARLQVLRNILSTRQETSQLAQWRLKAGETDALEASQAESSLESARASVPAIEQSIAQGKVELSRLAGIAPGSLDSLLNRTRPIPSPPSSLAIGIPADVLRQRPDVRVAGYQVLAAAANTRAAEAQRYPSLNLTGSLSLNTATSSNLFDPERAAANLAAGITSPIFDAGRIRSNIAAASAAEEQAIQNYRASVIQAVADTENALIACRRSAERLDSLEKATRLAREADDLARKRYQTGEIDFTTVLDTQRTLLSLEDSLLATRTDRTLAYVRLYQALGGGWSSHS